MSTAQAIDPVCRMRVDAQSAPGRSDYAGETYYFCSAACKSRSARDMDAVEIAVVIGGTAAIALVLWYFFGGRTTVTALADGGGVQEVRITVKGGYSPDVIVVRRGMPVRLHFYRDETASCSEQIVLGDFGIARDLPPYQMTTIEFTPDHEGEFTFTCGMNMMRGRLIVR